MKNILLTLTAFAVFITAKAQNNTVTQTIKGTVTDEQSGNTIAGVTISIENSTPLITSVTDEQGVFHLYHIPIGRQNIFITATGYEVGYLTNIEVTSSKEVVLDIKLKEKVKKLDEVKIISGKSKLKALNEAAVVSARQLSTDEAFRFSGTRNDPSRMAQNFAGVSGSNDGRNDIIIRGNSPAGVLWRMDGIDIPNPNHFSTLGATGGPVSILNINTLKNSDFLTSAFPSPYGNAVAGVFDLKLRNGNNEKNEFLAEMGFNGFEFGAEGPINKQTKSSYLVDYRYSMVATLQDLGFSFGTGSATPYYQDGTFKINLPTKKSGTFSIFGIGGESHIHFSPESQGKDNLYSTNDGSVRDRNFKSLTGAIGLSHTYFFNSTASGKFILAASGLSSKYTEDIVFTDKPNKPAYFKNNRQVKYTAGYSINKKFNARNQLTAGITADMNVLTLRQDYIKDGDSTLITFVNTTKNASLLKAYVNLGHRFNDLFSSNLGIYAQRFTLNSSSSIEPRWNMKYQFRPNQSFSFGAGLHSQTQPLEVYFYQTKDNAGNIQYTNHNLSMVKSIHTVLGYDFNFSKVFRLKSEIYGQYLYHAAVEQNASSFSMLNAGADFYFPDKTNLVNNGKGYNYGAELTIEHFLHKGLYYLVTVSVFQSKYKASDMVWRNTAYNSNYVVNALAGKEFKLNSKTSFGIDSKLTFTGGQRYTPFNIAASTAAGYVIYQENAAYSLQHSDYFRWDLKFSYNRNLKRVTQKWFVDLQNFTGKKNIYVQVLNPKTGAISQINQMGFFPNINYQITF